MELNSYPDLSPEQAYAHKLAAKEFVKYCQELDRWWRRTERHSAGLAPDPRRRGMLVPRLAVRLALPERQSAD